VSPVAADGSESQKSVNWSPDIAAVRSAGRPRVVEARHSRGVRWGLISPARSWTETSGSSREAACGRRRGHRRSRRTDGVRQPAERQLGGRRRLTLGDQRSAGVAGQWSSLCQECSRRPTGRRETARPRPRHDAGGRMSSVTGGRLTIHDSVGSRSRTARRAEPVVAPLRVSGLHAFGGERLGVRRGARCEPPAPRRRVVRSWASPWRECRTQGVSQSGIPRAPERPGEGDHRLGCGIGADNVSTWTQAPPQPRPCSGSATLFAGPAELALEDRRNSTALARGIEGCGPGLQAKQRCWADSGPVAFPVHRMWNSAGSRTVRSSSTTTRAAFAAPRGRGIAGVEAATEPSSCQGSPSPPLPGGRDHALEPHDGRPSPSTAADFRSRNDRPRTREPDRLESTVGAKTRSPKCQSLSYVRREVRRNWSLAVEYEAGDVIGTAVRWGTAPGDRRRAAG